jgi:hypothetical protein
LLDELMRTQYEERIVPATDEAATGLDRVLAHVDRLAALATEDERFLKAMFVLSFEAVRGSPALTPRITAWMTGLEKGHRRSPRQGQGRPIGARRPHRVDRSPGHRHHRRRHRLCVDRVAGNKSSRGTRPMAQPHHQRLCAHAANAAWDTTLVVRVAGLRHH